MKYGFGVDLGGTTVKIAYFNETGKILQKWEIPTVTANHGEQILPDIAASINNFIATNAIEPKTLQGIGIGVPGPVNDKGVVYHCANTGWEVVDIPTTLGKLTGLPVCAGNDATVAALGECWKGSGHGCKNLVLVTLGTGVGGGIVIDGHVIHGVHGAGGEIGHIQLNPAETVKCGCGRYGCVEQYCSATGIVRIAHRYLQKHDTPSRLRTMEDFSCKDVMDAAREEDEAAVAIMELVYTAMGKFLSDLCCVVDPEVIVFGGGVSRAGQPLLDGVKRHFDDFAFASFSDTRFALAELGNDAGAYGAFKLILDSCS